MRIMTFNLRTSMAEDGANSWKYRAKSVAKFISESLSDIICMQEGTPEMMKNLSQLVTRDFFFFGIGRTSGPENKASGKLSELTDVFTACHELVDFDEFNPIMVDANKYEVLDSGVFWLSENPDVPRTLYAGQHPLLPRICTWVKLKETKTGKELAVFNAHLEHISEDIRLLQIDVILDRIKDFKKQNPELEIFFTGDLNTRPVGEVYAKIISSDLKLKDLTADIDISFHGFDEEDADGDKGHKIDYIFTDKNVSIDDYITRNYVKDENGKYLSDHIIIESETKE